MSDTALPDLAEIQEEPIRPLLVVVETALEALDRALDAEELDDDAGNDVPDRPPRDLVQWTAHVVALQIDVMRTALDLFSRALRLRNVPRQVPRSTSDNDF